jgi:hypothetical protein
MIDLKIKLGGPIMKNYLFAVLGLMVMLIVLNFLFKLGKKTPLKSIVEKAEDLTGLDA